MKKMQNITIINDCRDVNAVGRQQAMVNSLFGSPSNFLGVNTDLEAAGNLIDTLNVYEDRPGIILVNVAPRNGKAKKWKNGTPFGWFKYKKVLVVSTIDGLTLSLVKKLQLAKHINVLELPEEHPLYAVSQKSQFRSLQFSPKIAKLLSDGKKVKNTKLSISEIPDPPKAIWWIDNFGNCKTTILEKEFGNTSHSKFYKNLKDVPDGEDAITVGSSGLGKDRFLELVSQGGDFAEANSISTGSPIDNFI